MVFVSCQANSIIFGFLMIKLRPILIRITKIWIVQERKARIETASHIAEELTILSVMFYRLSLIDIEQKLSQPPLLEVILKTGSVTGCSA